MTGSRSPKWAVVLILLACPGMAGCLDVFEGNRARRTEVATAEHVSDRPLRIVTRNGSVQVWAEPERQDVEIEATITCAGRSPEEAEARLADATLLVERDADGALVMRPVFEPQPRGGDGASVNVRLPGARGITIETSNGKVTVTGAAEAFSETVAVDTSNASVTVGKISGSVDLDSSNGSINVSEVQGDAIVDTSNGKVTVVDVSGSVNASSSNGAISILLTEHQQGPVTVRTSNASVDVAVGNAYAGEIVMGTSNGKIKLQDDAGRISMQKTKKSSGRIVLGEGGPSSRIRTSNGSISFCIIPGPTTE